MQPSCRWAAHTLETQSRQPADLGRSSAQMTANPEWTFTDGWILMSVYLTHGDVGASLNELIGAADAMNHAIPTTGELSRSLTRLATCGILTEVDNRYRIAEHYLPMIAKANQGKGGLFRTPAKGQKWLSRMTFDVNDAAEISITAEQSGEAYKQYRKRLRQK